MSCDTIMKDEEGVAYSYDNLKTQGWLEGHAPGAEAAANFIKEKAVELFKLGKDTEAVALRKLADEIKDKVAEPMREHAKRHEKQHPIVVTDGDES